MLKYLTLVISLCVCVCVCICVSHIQLCDPARGPVGCQAPLSMEFSRQEYWNLFLFPSPKYLFNPGIKHWSPELQADTLPPELPGKPSDFITFT